MAELSHALPGLRNVVAASSPSGGIMQVADILTQSNPLFGMLDFVECNDGLGHVVTSDYRLPTPEWAKIGQYIGSDFAETVQTRETCAFVGKYSKIPQRLIELNGNTAAYRALQDKKHIEAISQEIASKLIYGNSNTTPEHFLGLAPRYANQSAANGENIITSADTPDNADNTSIWLLGLSPSTVYGIYPKGTKAGLVAQDKGLLTVSGTNTDSSVGDQEMYVSYFGANIGLCVEDWRYAVRINFDLEDVIAAGTSGPVLDILMRKAIRRIHNMGMGTRLVFLANRDSLEAMDAQANAKSTLAFQNVMDAQGQLITTFNKIPVLQMDAILSTEAGI